MEIFWFLIIGLVAGFLAAKLIRGGGFGLVANLLVGVIGAILGGWLFGELGISVGGHFGSLITAFVGAVILLILVALIKK
jgi:uncharacterized membrane protein YeaQ/YmgE (transglycosylase-associated protein family)